MRQILVADDDRDAADLLARLLRWEKFQVHVAYHGAAAIELAVEHLPDALVLDLKMPEVNGFDVAERLRSLPDFSDKLFVALSGFGDQSHLQEAGRVQFDEYLVKPCKLRALLDVLQKAPGATTGRAPSGCSGINF